MSSSSTHKQQGDGALVSVIVPVYNRVEPLKRALKSVVAQTYKNLEVLVVDDGSTEDMKSVVDELNDERITFIRNEKNSNANVCRNIGIHRASGKYIAMLDSDDEWLPNHVQRRVQIIEETGADGLFGSHFINDGEKLKPVCSRQLGNGENMADYLLTSGTATTPTHFYNAQCAKAVMWDEGLKRHQDFDFSINFSKRFNFQPCTELTVIVHWEKGVKRSESYRSQMRFIEKHKSSISPRIYNQYHSRNFFSVADREDIESSIVEHYRKESYRYPHHVTRTEFMSVAGHRAPAWKRLLLRIKFALLVFQ